MREKQVRTISLIFQKDKNGHYTKSALLYQNIIRYYIARLKDGTTSDYFTHRDLAKWLLKNHNEFIDYYKDLSTRHIKESNRIENTQKRIKDQLNDLIELQIIEVAGNIEVQKGTGTTPLYQYIAFGIFMALIILSFDPNKREFANNEIYNLVQLVPRQSSYDIFKAALYKKYKERGIFGSFVVDALRERLESNSQATDKHDLYHRVGILYVHDTGQSEFFVNLWFETLNELDPTTRALVLHRIKLEIERRMEDKAEDVSKFELVRFKIKHRHDAVALEGYCTKCKTRYSIDMDLKEYLRLANFIPWIPVKMDCALCGEFCYTINLIEY